MSYYSPKVLYVDDDRVSYQILREQLPAEIIIEHAESGEACLECVKNSPPDLIIINMDLPDAAGSKISQKLRTNAGTEEVEQLLISDIDYEEKEEDLDYVEMQTIKIGKRHEEVYPKCNPVHIIEKVKEILNISSHVKQMTILIADDSKTVVEMLSHYIEQMGHKTVIVHDGLKAVAAVKDPDNEFDVILMDGQMPKLNGLETTRQIRAYSKANWIPIIFVSSNHDAEYIEQAIQYGADDYLVKPVSFIILRSKIQAMARLANMRVELKAANNALAKLSHYDPLTNVYNRRAYDEYLAKEWKRMTRDGTTMCLLLVDVDNFKLYNEHYGHKEADEALLQVAQCIGQEVKRPADFLARYGGDVFVILFPGMKLKKTAVIGERIVKLVENLEIMHEGSTVSKNVTVSVGLCSSADCENMNELFAQADNALYQAKESGRNRLIVYNKS